MKMKIKIKMEMEMKMKMRMKMIRFKLNLIWFHLAPFGTIVNCFLLCDPRVEFSRFVVVYKITGPG